MSEDPIKKRMVRAKHRAQKELRADEHVVIPSNNDPVCLVAYRLSGEVRLIRICLDSVSQADKTLMRPYSAPPSVSAECWMSRLRTHRFIITRL